MLLNEFAIFQQKEIFCFLSVHQLQLDWMHIFSSHVSNFRPFLACKQTILSFINANKMAFHLSLLKHFSHVWKYVIAHDLKWNYILLRFQIIYSFNPSKKDHSPYQFQSSMYWNSYCCLITIKVIRATFGKLKMFYTILFSLEAPQSIKWWVSHE